jgi:2-haloacid dehalogenase
MQLEYTWLQTSLLEYRDFGFLTRASLEFALRAAGVESSERITGPLFEKYLDLDPFPEAKDALRQLKSLGGYKLAILSNGSTTMLSALVKNSGLGTYLDATARTAQKGSSRIRIATLSSRKCSGSKATKSCSYPPTALTVVGAKHFGFKVTWIRRGGAAVLPAGPVSPAQMYRLVRGNPELHGFRVD